ncbi:hypothetical protein [Lentibacillus sp. Marseille-P4043]|uniref:hypothetical protein n=1 Tax=Lentibacillus sp. Marseille-P4043 TaxID=2040293 RepID=UPI000D0BC5CE|nr:hypothetical protein [Lentibacillus sp. Marseille-P4043]
MIKWLAVVTLVWILYQYEKRFMIQEGHDERGKMILYKSRSRTFTYVLIGWTVIHFINSFYHLTYNQFKDAIAIIVVGVLFIQFIYLFVYRRKY